MDVWDSPTGKQKNEVSCIVSSLWPAVYPLFELFRPSFAELTVDANACKQRSDEIIFGAGRVHGDISASDGWNSGVGWLTCYLRAAETE